MSNRLAEADRLPLITDPELAMRAGEFFIESRARSLQAAYLGHAYRDLFACIPRAFRWLERTINEAETLRDSAISRVRSETGDIPNTYVKSRVASLG